MKVSIYYFLFIWLYAAQSNADSNLRIIFWGQAGAGISSTLKSVLGKIPIRRTTNIGTSTNGTNYITEYKITPPGSSTSTILLDVAGLNSKPGQDAETMSALLKYIKNPDHNASETVLVLVSPFNDLTFYDGNSDFIVMLKKVARFQEVLLNQTNITTPTILVLSKLMMESKLVSDKPEVKTVLFKNAIVDLAPATFRQLTRSILIGENKPELNRLSEKDGWTNLPNGEQYPKNVLDKITSLLQQSDSKNGLKSFIGIRTSTSQSPGLTERKFYHQMNSSAYDDFLLAAHISVVEGGIEDVEISRKLIDQYAQGYSETYPSYSLDALLQLQYFLQSKSIKKVDQLPKSGPNWAKLLLDMSYHPKNDGLFELLRDTFNVPTTFPVSPNEKNVSIIIMGKGESGISSTVQKILGPSAQVTTASTRPSSSSDDDMYVTQYEVTIPGTTATLKLIDVEGLIEGKPADHDYKVLSSLVSYLASGQDAPTFWLIISNFNDNKFLGERTNFAKMAKSVARVQSVVQLDREELRMFRNTFLFTKLMTESGKNQRNPEIKGDLFSSAVNRYSFMQTSDGALFGENMSTQQESNGYVKLPNGEVYPENIFDNWLYQAKSDGLGGVEVIQKFKDLRASLVPYNVVKSYY